MRKHIYLFCLIFTISGCYYSFKDDCWYGVQTNCIQRNYKSDIQRYSKVDGQPVNEEQKINDIKACGAIPDKNGYFLSDIRKSYPYTGGIDYGAEAVKKIGECMKTKGYKYDSIAT